MKYKTIIDHWEVEYTVKSYADGKPLLKHTDIFKTEDEAIKFAREKDTQGENVTVRVVENVCCW